MSKTKIVCTLGPASSSARTLFQMMKAGMDIARLNFSHGSHARHLSYIRLVRELNHRHHSRLRILGDLEGYRIRIGHLKKGEIPVKKGQILYLTSAPILGEKNLIPFDFEGRLEWIKKDQLIFIDDGRIALEVQGHDSKNLKTRVLVPGLLKERKGINMPEVRLPFEGLTKKDREDALFCIKNGIECIAQSFVRKKEDVRDLKAYLGPYAKRCRIIAKIENREGIEHIDEILKECDGIMVARGDMGVSIPIYKVPVIQKQIIKKCKKAGKISITATQMLESMTENRTPTRAEVSDVANAILDGSSAVMLSAETAVGSYPVSCVDMMDKIIRFTEARGVF